MGQYFRGGKLRSADTVTISGERALANSNESVLWQGVTETRPTPGGIQLRVISDSTEDDNVKQQSGTITVTGTMEPAVADLYTVTAGGAVDTGDIANIVFDGTNYSVEIGAGITTTTHVATALTAALTDGTKDVSYFAIGVGGADASDNLRLTLDGTPYDVTLVGAETAAQVCAAMETAASGDANYDVTQAPPTTGTFILVSKKVAGVNAGAFTCVWTVDTGADATSVEMVAVVGAAAITAYTAVANVADVEITQDTAGAAGTVVVTSSYTTDPGVDSTLVTVHTATGADADVLAVNDGTTTFSSTVVSTSTTTEATTLAAVINAGAAYSATAATNVITVVAAVGGVAFAFTDVSTDNQTGDISLVIDNTANETSDGGTGLRTLRLDYIDTAGVRQAETITMNGTTAVFTASSTIKDVLGVSALTVGSGGGAAGTIDVTNGAGSIKYEIVKVASCQSRSAAYTVPAGNNLFVVDTHATATTGACVVRLYSDTNPATGAIVSGAKFEHHVVVCGTNAGGIANAVALGPCPAGALGWVTAKDGNPTTVAVGAGGYLGSG